jgi:hypothetical protein
MATVEERLNTLEKKVDWYRRATAMLAMVLVAGVVMGQAKPEVAEEIRCRNIVVVDYNGEERASITVDGIMPTLTLRNTQGLPGVQMFVVGDTPALYLNDSKGKPMVEVHSKNTGGILSVYNKTGERIVDLSADEYGNGVVGAWNRKGKGRTLTPGP